MIAGQIPAHLKGETLLPLRFVDHLPPRGFSLYIPLWKLHFYLEGRVPKRRKPFRNGNKFFLKIASTTEEKANSGKVLFSRDYFIFFGVTPRWSET